MIAGLFARTRPALLQTVCVDSTALGRPLPVAVLRAPDPEAPVVLLLHGLGDDHLALDRHGVAPRLQRGMRDGSLPPVHLVAPDGERGFYINWFDGSQRYEDHVVGDVLELARRELGPRPRQRCHILGLSMGGIGALQIGLRHPDRFASVTCISGPILDEAQADRMQRTSIMRFVIDMRRVFGRVSDREFFEAHNPHVILRRRGGRTGLERLFIAAGRRDKPFIRESTLGFHALLRTLGTEHDFELYDGRHCWRDWTPVIERALRRCVGPGQTAEPGHARAGDGGMS